MLTCLVFEVLKGCKECGQFVSSCLPRNVMHATTLEISGRSLELHHISNQYDISAAFIPGFLSPRSAPRNTIGTRILHAVQCYRNLNAVQISPTTFPAGIFVDVLFALRNRPSIRHLTV